VIRRIVCFALALLFVLSAFPAGGEVVDESTDGATEYPPAVYDFSRRKYDSYTSDTLVFTIETFNMAGTKCVLTKIWVRDPARQIRKANAPWKEKLADPKELTKLVPGAVLSTNASGYITKTYPDLPENYPGDPSDYYNTTLGSLVITDREILRRLDGVPFYGLALSEDGISMYQGADNALVLATDPCQTWAFFEVCAIQVNGTELLPGKDAPKTAKETELVQEKHARTVLARVNRNNYLMLHVPYGKSYRGLDLYQVSAFFSANFKTEWVYNLDGGYSTALIHKPQTKNARLQRLVPNVQQVADILCFTE